MGRITRRKRKHTARSIRGEHTARNSIKLSASERELLAIPKEDWASAKALERIVKTALRSERRKLARTLNELFDYLESNRDLIPDYGDRRRHGEAISSSIAESTVNQVH